MKKCPVLSLFGIRNLPIEDVLAELWKVRGQIPRIQGWFDGLELMGAFEDVVDAEYKEKN